MEYPKTRKEAKEQGATHYYTGEPCSRGHVALRKTKGACIECMREDWVLDNAKRSLKPKSDAAKAAGKRYYERNKEVVIARSQARPHAEVKQYKQKYKEANPELYKALVSVRRRKHREATPPWVTKEQKLEMRNLYLQAQQLTKITGEKYEVDHKVPLIHPKVCGLHVPWNLQIMSREENLKKSNKHLAET